MIETIYRTERDEKGGPDINVRLPKNIKQIGQSDNMASCQIYIEENVISYIKQQPQDEKQLKYGVFLGDIKKGNGYTYIFINGLIDVEEVLESTIIFGDEVWTSIYDNMKRYYREGMVVGWYGSFENTDVVDMQRIRKIHLDHFAGNHRVFLCVDRQEDEEAFYIYEGNGMKKQSCYHVYFEKSEAFEDYLFSTGHREREVKVKEPRYERGKYGIALNNSIGRKEEPSKDGPKEAVKEVAKVNLSKVASWGAILALTGVLAAMGLNGDLDALGQGVKNLADNVMNNGDDGDDIDNIIPINGSPTNTGNNPSTSGTDETSTGEDESTSGDEATSGDETASGAEEETSNTDNETSSKTATEDGQEETTEDSEQANSVTYRTYIIEKGDTLYSLAMELYGDASKVEEIVEINNLEDENHIEEGQKIFLP